MDWTLNLEKKRRKREQQERREPREGVREKSGPKVDNTLRPECVSVCVWCVESVLASVYVCVEAKVAGRRWCGLWWRLLIGV